ncbi:MAG: hypothetical protein VW352_04165, partial [Gammaproteobacteria bacterium]
ALLGTNEFLLAFEPTRLPAHFLLRNLEITMNEEQEELFGQYIAEFALENDLKLDDNDIMKAIELFDECSHRWQSDSNVSIQDMAKDLDFDEMDEDIVEMVSVVWKKIYAN